MEIADQPADITTVENLKSGTSTEKIEKPAKRVATIPGFTFEQIAKKEDLL